MHCSWPKYGKLRVMSAREELTGSLNMHLAQDETATRHNLHAPRLYVTIHKQGGLGFQVYSNSVI